LGPLSSVEAGQMLNTVGKRVSLEWTNDAVELAHELSGGHVLLLRELASAVLKNQRHTRTTTTIIKRAHIHAVVPSWRENVASHVKEVLPHLRRYYTEEADLAIMLIEDPASFGEYATMYPANIKRLRELGIVSLDTEGVWEPSKILEFSYEFVQRPERADSPVTQSSQSGEQPLADQVIKACLGFLNQRGGTVLVGVSDSNEVIGITPDIRKKGSTDKLILHLNNLIRDKVGPVAIGLINITTPSIETGEMVMRIDVGLSDKPVFTNAPVDKKNGLFVRNNNSTSLLNDAEAHDYIVRHWPRQP
jgi:hypothetical protein